MISTAERVSIFDRTSSFICVVEWNGQAAYDRLKEKFEAAFGEKKTHYVVLNLSGDKELEERELERTTIISKKSLNVLGKWKSPEELNVLRSQEEKVIVYFCTESNKLVNKLLKLTEHVLSVGFENEKLINFDLAFRIDTQDQEQLLEQAKKYLKKL